MSRFTKFINLVAVVLVIAVVNVYVMGAPMKVVTDPNKADAPKTTETKAETVLTETSATKTLAAVSLAAEKLPLAPGTRTNFNRIFSKSEIKSRVSSDHNFLNVKSSARSIFKAPPKTGTALPADADSDDEGSSKGTWIAVGVIAAVLTIAVIGLRHDRSQTGVQ